MLLCLTYGFDQLQLRSVLFSTLGANAGMRGFLERFGVPLRDVGAPWHATAHNYVLEAAQWPAVRAALGEAAPQGAVAAEVAVPSLSS